MKNKYKNLIYTDIPIYNKKDIINFMLLDWKLNEKEKIVFTEDIARLSKPEFEIITKRMGLTKIGRGFWV